MHIPKRFLNRMVEITWRDPITRNHDNGEKKGLDALAQWREWGVIDDLTDGVIRVIHSAGRNSPEEADNDFFITWIPQALVTKIRLVKYSR